MQKKNILIFGGSRGLGNLIKKKFIKSKKYKIFSVSRFLSNLESKNNIQQIKCNIFNQISINKFKKKIIKENIVFDTIIYSIGDHFDFAEKLIDTRYLHKLLKINLYFPIDFNNFLIKNKKIDRSKFIFILTDALYNLKAKSSYIIAKGASKYYIKSQSNYLKKINCSIVGVVVGPYLYPGSVWDRIKKNDPERFERKKKSIKSRKFPKPEKYVNIIEKIIKKNKIQNGKIFK